MRTEVEYRDRASGALVREPIAAEGAMRWLYETPLGFWVLNRLMTGATVSHLVGWFQDSGLSRRSILPFAERCGVRLEDALAPVETFGSFNAFFERRLKPEARPWDPDPAAFCAPGDGKLLVYPALQDGMQMPIKGRRVDMRELLRTQDAARFAGGAAFVLRLAPYDYHRFHFPIDGVAAPAEEIPGLYHSVNPIALARVPEIFLLNKRMVTYVDSALFGRVALVEVGALNVGTIVQTYTPGPVHKGDEKGTFRFGGSTIVVLVEPGRLTFDPDLVADSQAGIEVQVLAGTRIGLASQAF